MSWLRSIASLVLLASCGGDPSVSDADSGSRGASSSGGTAPSGSADATISPETDADTTVGTTTDSSTTEASADETASTPFEHDVYTLLTELGRLALHSNLPPEVDACLALPVTDAPCEDLDLDGLVDAWEDAVLERLRPLRRFDEAESAIDDPAAVMADVGRVITAADGSYRLLVMLGYSRDYGSCGFTSHNGDSERVVLALAPLPAEGAGGVVMEQAYTAAHEGTPTDHGRSFAGGELDQLVLAPDPDSGQPRWVVFPSADKHATYATVEICEGISVVPCFDEDCDPDGVPDPSLFDVLPMAANAGEPEAPRLTDLTPVGFPGDDAWADQDFCGGLGGTGCSSSVRSKLLTDPFP